MGKKKYFEGVWVSLPVGEKKRQVSGYLKKMFTDLPGWKWEYVGDIIDEKSTIDEVIFKITGVKLEEDFDLYNVFRRSLQYQVGEHAVKNMREPVLLKNTIDIGFVFNTDVKINMFLAYFMNFSMKTRINGDVPVVAFEGSFVFDFSYFLLVLENYLVEECGAEREKARKYLRREFLNTDNAFFLFFGIFGIGYKLLTVKISNVVYLNKSNDEVRKYYVPAWYKSNDGNRELFFKQMQFSKEIIRSRVEKAEKSRVSTPLTNALFTKFSLYLSRHNMRQIAWGKLASEYTKEYRKEEKMIPLFYQY